MNKKLLSLITFFMIVLTASAQKINVLGTVFDGQTNDPLIGAAVKCTNENEKLISGVVTNSDGNFVMHLKKKGLYVISITSVGHKPFKMKCHINETMKLGDIKLDPDNVILDEAVVTGSAAKVVVKGDTIAYNASAYKLPEGSPVEELIRRLPGAKIDENGKITINGKEIKKILLDGKEFMTGDNDAALKNIPVDIIRNVKTYNKQSDMARITGIDDGEEEEVIDFGIMPGMNNGVFANANLSYGNHGMHQEKVMASKFNDTFKIMGFGNITNTNEAGFHGGKSNNDGLRIKRGAGVNINLTLPKFDMDLGVRVMHPSMDVQTVSASQNFVSNYSSFGNAQGKSNSSILRLLSFGRMEWRPDSMNTFMYRHYINFNKSDKKILNNSLTFSEDPYQYFDDPIDAANYDKAYELGILTNRRINTTMSYDNSKNANFTLMYNHKFGKKGRNFHLRGNLRYTDDEKKDITISDVRFFNMMGADGKDSTYVTNRFNKTPVKSWTYSGEVAYTEPIAKKMYLQLKYRYTRNEKKSDKMVYDFASEMDNFDGIMPRYRGWGDYIARLNNPLDYYIDDDLCRYSKHTSDDNKVSLIYKYIDKKINFHAGVDFYNQHTRFIQDYKGVFADTVRNVNNISPSMSLRYRINKMNKLNFYVYSYTSQPSMTDLMDITDDTDPLNIHKGNPGLKPSINNTLRADYYNFSKKRNRSIAADLYVSTTKNSFSNAVTYDNVTGGKIIRPENINGNWSLSGSLSYSTELDSLGRWNLSTYTAYSHQNYVNYFTPMGSDKQKNTTRDDIYSADVRAGYRMGWMEVELNGAAMYNHTRNVLQPDGNFDSWKYSYGTTLMFSLPWNMTLNTDLRMHSRRGYSDAGMNTDELVWNAQITQALLKDKTLSLSLKFYDILQQQSTVSRNITAMMRNDVTYNSINSYAMLSLVYKINIVGGKRSDKDNYYGSRKGYGKHHGRSHMMM